MGIERPQRPARTREIRKKRPRQRPRQFPLENVPAGFRHDGDPGGTSPCGDLLPGRWALSARKLDLDLFAAVAVHGIPRADSHLLDRNRDLYLGKHACERLLLHVRMAQHAGRE